MAVLETSSILAIEVEGKQDLRTKVMMALFGLFAEVDRDLISERTKEGLAAAKAKGKLLGRPKGALGTSRLDGKEQDIRALLGKDVSKASIAKRGGPHRLDHLAAFLRWTPQFLLPPVREILRGGEPEGKVPLRMFFQASVHLLRRRPSVRRVRSLAVV